MNNPHFDGKSGLKGFNNPDS